KMPGWFLPGQILLIVGIFYFLIIRPQGQARKKQEELLNALKAGDDVMTAGGLLGKVKKVEEKNGEWRVTLDTGTSTVVVERSRVIRVGDKSAPQA
ncbi:MAG TPA: preprotein translocase subunit YajC, partial [Gemmatimonadales bacterium]|nr:preprotein translocase subunit YajC [Gemmatimonadales bacterium]